MPIIWNWTKGKPINLIVRDGRLIEKTSEGYHHAAIVGDVDEIRRFVEKGGDINQGNADGWTALMLAAFNGEVATVKALIDHGADTDLTNDSGQTALILAVVTKHADICPELRKNQMETVRALLESEANRNLKDKNGWTALRWAKHNRLYTVIQLMAEYNHD